MSIVSTAANFSKRFSFETERFTVVLLSPPEGRELVDALLQDEVLAARVPWLTEKTRGGRLRVTYGIELQITAGQLNIWGIMTRELQTQIGAIIVRNSLEGIDVEMLIASQFWDTGVSEEAGEPVMEWLEDNPEVFQNFPIHMH